MLLTLKTRVSRSCVLGIALVAIGASCRPEAGADRLRESLQAKLEELHGSGSFPGATFGVALADGSSYGLAVGLSDQSNGTAMRPDDRLLAGSIGKTFVSALALILVGEGRLGLDDPVGKWLGDNSWYAGLPNADELTVRMLMNHTTGIPDYVVNPEFIQDLFQDPERVWPPEELVQYEVSAKALFAAGTDYHYTDTNYILRGMVIERASGSSYYTVLGRRVLEPFDLDGIVPSDSRRIERLSQGYPGESMEAALRGYGEETAGAATSPAGAATEALVDGEFVINPQFEWTGGGLATTAVALARWAKLVYEGQVFPESLLPEMLDGVDADEGVKYGLGVFIRETPLGPAYGHGGFFPGYRSEMMYFPDDRFAVAIQFNSNVGPSLGPPTVEILLELASLVRDHEK